MSADFDYINSVTKAYRFVFRHIPILIMMAMVPFAVKLTNYLIVEALGYTDNTLRQGLLLMPAFFAEGWLIARIVRFAVQGEMIEQHLTGNPELDLKLFEGHMRAVTASMIVFVLIKLVLSLFVGLFMFERERLAETMPVDQPEYTTSSVFIGFVLIGIGLYMFRFLWLYIPVAMGYDMGDFLRRIKSFSSSVYLFAMYIICFVPLSFFMLGGMNITAGVFGGVENESYSYVAIFIQALIDTVLTILVSIAIGFGVQAVYSGNASEEE